MTSFRSKAKLSLAAARRVALAAQGFGQPRPARPPDRGQIVRLVRRLGALQLDSVNVFMRAHYMPVFSRLGPYDRTRLDRLAGHGEGPIDRRLVEYWAHEASLIPVELHPLLRWRMADVDREAWGSISRVAREQPELVAETLELVADQGPIRARDTGAVRAPPRPGHMWNWHEGKVALEHLFFTGRVGAARRVNFERLYDTIERVLPREVLDQPTPSPADAQRELVRIAARALGVATEPDLGDYFRLPRAASKARVAELVAAGELIEGDVEGWSAPAYIWPDARRPRRIRARTLLSPFDSLIWFRQRTERLFGFRYRIEIYTPAAKRIYGYYVLPFLLGEELVARVDLKSDRTRGALLVQGAFAEPDVDRIRVARELADELDLLASWLGLEEVVVAPRGDLARELARSPAQPRREPEGVLGAIRGSLVPEMSDSRITPGVIYKAVVLAFALVIAAMIFHALASLILGLLIVVIIATPLAAFADLLERYHCPRAIGAVLGLLLGLAAVAGLVALIVPVFTREVNDFAHSLPAISHSLTRRLGRLTGSSPEHVTSQIQHFVNSYTHNPGKLLGPAASIGAGVAAGIAAIIVILLTSLYTAIHPDPLQRGLIRLFPIRRRAHVYHVMMRLRTAYLGWLRGMFVGMVVLGGLTYLGLLAVGLNFAAFFAVFTAVAMIVPYFGALVSSIPPILYALTISTQKAVLVAIIYILAHQLESNVIQPLVVARTVKLHPAVVAIGVVAVEQLFGFIGLLVAVPIIATATILVDELWIKPLEQREDGVPVEQIRRASAEGLTVRGRR